MAKAGPPRRRPEGPSFTPTTLTEITRRYFATAVALSKAMGVPMSETFMKEHRESISTCFIEAGRAGVRLAATVQLPPLATTNGQTLAPELADLPTTEVGADVPDFPPPPNGDTPPLTAADLPTRIPAGLQLPCAEALIVDLRPPQLSLLIGKVGLKALADHSLEPLHVALLAERASRLQQGRKTTGEG